MNEFGAPRDDALEDIAYLSRSSNRVQLLETLADSPHTRSELGDVTGASRTTLGRILAELEDRGWAERTVDGNYAATTRGEHVTREFTPLVEAMESIRDLGDAVNWLPSDELSIGLQHFSDATVIRSEPNAPMEMGRYHAELLRDATHVHTLTYIGPPAAVGEAAYDGVVSGRLAAEHVMAGGLVDYIRDHPEEPPPWQEYIEAGARVYRYEGHIPCHLFIADETVHLTKPETDPSGAVIESTNETVREWAIGLIETYREDAQRVEGETFT